MRALLALCLLAAPLHAADPWLTFPGGDGPGKGKKIVLVSGDEEYRSEEALPMLAQLLSKRHGFACTVLFAIDPKTGTVQPNVKDNIPGLEMLADADLMVIATRMRNLPDAQMKHVIDYVESGKPVIGLRTATHAFEGKTKYSWTSKEKGFEGGFGKQVFGETWVAHHGNHGSQGTRGVFTKEGQAHPILKGVAPGSVFGPTDVYAAKPIGDSVPLVLGEVTQTLKPDSPAVKGPKNEPMMPVAWVKSYTGTAGKPARVFTTTMGASQDFEYEGTRRMVVNACLWVCGLEDKIPEQTNVEFVTPYKPTGFSFKKDEAWKPGRTPAEMVK